MRLSFHNSATVAGPERLLDANGAWRWRNYPVRYGVLDHPKLGLVLLDTGYEADLFSNENWRVRVYRNLLRPKLLPLGDAAQVVQNMGAKAEDVRHIILTHLHADHMCGLSRFPNARLYMSAASLQVWRGELKCHGFFSQLMPTVNSREICVIDDKAQHKLPWAEFGFDVLGDGSALAVPLPGHMIGHLGVYFPTLAQPIFHAADADWTLQSLFSDQPATRVAQVISDDAGDFARSKALVRRAAGYAQISLCHDDSAG